jgi:CheY-like chemotaxis protein
MAILQQGGDDASVTRLADNAYATTLAGWPPGTVHAGDWVFSPGEMLGDHYRVLRLIGLGSMAQVFEAEDQVLQRRVAIKVQRPPVSPRTADLLRREAQALAAVQHPGVVTVYGHATHRATPYIVMERIHGNSLEAHLAQRNHLGTRFTVAETLDLLLLLTDGLTAIHRAGIAHRDVKPGNVLLAPGNRAVLTDLGVFVPEVEAGRGVCEIVGTPYYMAPEAVMGRIAPGEANLLDVYSVGVIAFELLTGQRPYDGSRVVDVLSQQIAAPVPRASTFVSGLPERLVQLVGECMAKDPHDRPPGIESVNWQLRAIRSRAPAPSVAERFAVLVVDDDPDAAALLGACAERAIEGAKVLTAQNVVQALRLVQRRPPNLLLLDLEIPGMNGIELCMCLRGTHLADRCTIVLVSGKAGDCDRALLRQLGVVHFVHKGPNLVQELTDTLAELAPLARQV